MEHLSLYVALFILFAIIASLVYFIGSAIRNLLKSEIDPSIEEDDI